MSKFDKNQIVNWKFKRLYRQIRRPSPTSYEKKGKSPFSRFLVLGSFIRAIRGWADPTTDNIRAHIYQYQNIYHLSSLSNIFFFYLPILLSIHLYIYLSNSPFIYLVCPSKDVYLSPGLIYLCLMSISIWTFISLY